MAAELIVVSGPLTGSRYPLAPGAGIAIGRDATCAIRLADAAVSWRHCAIAEESGVFRLRDLRSGGGTFVNGLRVTQCALSDNDHVQLGETLLLFRDGAAPPVETSARPALLNACVLVFLFRALAECTGQPQAAEIEREIVRLLSDLLPVSDGWILSGSDPAALATQCRERHLAPLEPLTAAVCAQGAASEGPLLGVPVYVKGGLQAVIAVQLRIEPPSAEDAPDLLAAAATLAGIAWESAQEIRALRTENALLEERLALDTEIRGNSAAIQRLLELIQRVAPRDTTVLILGESGTGKELVARTLHRNSTRKDRPFVAINCAALTETLLESELFGHEKGAFTGAVAQKKGKLEMAEGGTVFLDEIGELAPGLQAKLLRVLQQREFERVGSTRTQQLNIRLLAATNRDLAAEVRKGTFREDLFHRLNVVTLKTPPLRERRDDITGLAQHFLIRAASQCRRRVSGISAEALRLLTRYSWPGNVRELENAIERAVVLGGSEEILAEDLPESLYDEAAVFPDAGTAYQATVTDAKRDSILRAYEQGGGDYKEAARILGIHPNYLLRLVRNLDLKDAIRKRLSTAG